MDKTIDAKFLVGSTLVVVGVKFANFDFSTLSQARSALDVEYRVQGSTTWTKLSEMANKVTVRTVSHLYHNDWKFERNLWRTTVSGLTANTAYDMRVRVSSDYTEVAQFTTTADQGDMELSFTSTFNSHTELKTALANFWSTLYTNNIRACGMLNPGSMPMDYLTSGDPGSYVFSKLVWGSYFDGKDSATYLNDEVNDTEGTTAIGRNCRNAFTFLHEMRHLFGCSPLKSTNPGVRQGWQGRGTFNEIDTNASFLEVGKHIAGQGYPLKSKYTNTVGAYYVDRSSGTSYNTRCFYAKPPSGQQGNDCQLAEVYQFMRGSDNVHPRMSGDHSNLADGPFYEGTSGTCVADIEMVFLLRALLFDKIETRSVTIAESPEHQYNHEVELEDITTLATVYNTELPIRSTNEAFKLDFIFKPYNNGSNWSYALRHYYLFACINGTDNSVGTYASFFNMGSSSSPIWYLVVNGHYIALDDFRTASNNSVEYHITYEMLSPSNVSITVVGTKGNEVFMNISDSNVALSSEAAELLPDSYLYIKGCQGSSGIAYGRTDETVLKYDLDPVFACSCITSFTSSSFNLSKKVTSTTFYDENCGLLLYCEPQNSGETLSYVLDTTPAHVSLTQLTPNLIRLNYDTFLTGTFSAFNLVVTNQTNQKTAIVNIPATTFHSDGGVKPTGYVPMQYIDRVCQKAVAVPASGGTYNLNLNPYYRNTTVPYRKDGDTLYYLNSDGSETAASVPWSRSQFDASSWGQSYGTAMTVSGSPDNANACLYHLSVTISTNSSGAYRYFFINMGNNDVVVFYQSAS